jgi:xanthine dehydrogenase iron-sulfur cluster and FAD-binding subunit A
VRELEQVDPPLTVLNYLRGAERRCGTKEGCAEGDCGAYTVVLGEVAQDRLRYRAVNAYILFVPALDGKELVTVELAPRRRRASPRAEGDGRMPRLAMRILHAGLRHVALRAL